LQIVNDDGDLLHHSYVDSPNFSFDSEDQQPGSKTDITFSVAGNFDVLCAIHPKMRLIVHVRFFRGPLAVLRTRMAAVSCFPVAIVPLNEP
jgi:hypothetical protein